VEDPRRCGEDAKIGRLGNVGRVNCQKVDLMPSVALCAPRDLPTCWLAGAIADGKGIRVGGKGRPDGVEIARLEVGLDRGVADAEGAQQEHATNRQGIA